MTEIELAALVEQYTGLTDKHSPAYAQAYRLAHAVATASVTTTELPEPAAWICLYDNNDVEYTPLRELAEAAQTAIPLYRAEDLWKVLPSPAEDGQ